MKCEYCKKKHEGLYGSGRFCSKSCYKGFCTKNKRSEINKKVSKKLKGKVFYGKIRKPVERVILKCLNCQKDIETLITRSKGRRFCSKTCITTYFVHKRLREGTHKGYTVRPHTGPSWAEQFVINHLDNLKINYKFQYKINRFYVDFAFLDYKIVLEIDGRQHQYPVHIERDKRRDKLIKKEGWKIVRIPWRHKSYEIMYDKINLFLTTQIKSK
jgi:very-short-patch-repair endonuclease